MTHPAPTPPSADVDRALGVLPSVFDGYGRLYAPLALAGFLVPFTSLFQDIEDDGITRTFDSTMVMAVGPNGDEAALGVFLMLVLVVMLLTCIFRAPRSAGLPIAIAVVSAIEVLLLATKAGLTDPKPEFTESGVIALVVAITLCAVSLVHAGHLLIFRRAS